MAETGTDTRVPLIQWEGWLANGAYPLEHPMVERALRAVLPALRTALPTQETVAAGFDGKAKRRFLEREQEDQQQAAEAQIRDVNAHNMAFDALLGREIYCPFCHGSRLRFVDVAPKRKSYFICQQCARSFGPAARDG